MKNILITGTNSYIGKSFERWLKKEPDTYNLKYISLRDDLWKEQDFSNYDVILHVAGIAHRTETKENQDLYYKINRDLTYEIAQKSKLDGVKQFIFLSTMSVYGLSNGIIDENTPLKPKNHYGKSKLKAEELIQSLENENFKIAIVRPPMVYGKGCKGNYTRLSKLAKITPIFPSIENRRSMIYIDNLSEFIKLLIDKNCSGLFFPQNKDYIKTSEMMEQIALSNGKKIKLIGIFNPLLKKMNINIINKVFGNLTYDKDMSPYIEEYSINNLKSSIEITEKADN